MTFFSLFACPISVQSDRKKTASMVIMTILLILIPAKLGCALEQGVRAARSQRLEAEFTEFTIKFPSFKMKWMTLQVFHLRLELGACHCRDGSCGHVLDLDFSCLRLSAFQGTGRKPLLPPCFLCRCLAKGHMQQALLDSVAD